MAITLTPELQDVADSQSQQNASQTPVPVIPASVPAPAALQAPDQNDEDAAISSLTAARPQPGFIDRFKASAENMPVAHAVPGSWARSLVASAVNALGGLADASQTPVNNGGSGILEGISQTLANRDARLRQQQQDQQAVAQRNIENQRQDKLLTVEQQRANANIAEAHANELHISQMSRNEDAEAKQKIQTTSASLAEPFLAAGAQNLGSNLTSDDLKKVLCAKNYDSSKVHVFQDGFSGVIDAAGNPVIGADGQQVMRPTYNLVGPVPQITLDKPQAAFLSKYSGQKFSAGDSMAGDVYYLIGKRAASQQAVEMNVEKVKDEIAASLSAKQRDDAETREKNLSNDEKIANRKASAAFAPYLAANNGDPLLAMQQMTQDPKGRANVGAVEQLYGPGNLARARQNELAQLQKTLEDNAKVIAEHSVPGAAPLPDEELSEIQSDTRSARARRNVLLGLAKQDPPQFAESVAALNKLPQSQRAAAINDPKAALSGPAREYLLRFYGLEPQPTQQPQSNGGR